MVWWVPVAGGIYRQGCSFECLDVTVERRDDFVASRYGQTAPRQKIVLHIHQQQRVAGVWAKVQSQGCAVFHDELLAGSVW